MNGKRGNQYFKAEILSADEKIREKTKKVKKKRSIRQFIFCLCFAIFAFAVLAVLSLTVFFKAETIDVEGSLYYTADAIIAETGIQTGDNLFRIGIAGAEKKLLDAFPYIESVTISRDLPNKVVISVTNASADFAVETNGTYLLFSKSGRVLESAATVLPEEAALVDGLQNVSSELCGKICPEGDATFASFSRIVNACKKCEFGKITEYNFLDETNIYLMYDNRLKILLGSISDCEDKIRLAKKTIDIEDASRPDQTALVDVSDSKAASVRDEDHTMETVEEDNTQNAVG